MTLRRRSVLFALLAVSPLAAPLTAADAWPTSTKQAAAVGTGGAVASDNLDATRAGLRVLKRGGTAADAAVAVASTLGVSDPLCGRDRRWRLFRLLRRPGAARVHDRRSRDGAGRRHPEPFIDPSTGKPLSFPTAVTSGLSVGVPGTLMTWQRALNRWGRFGLADDLPAERTARRGFVVDATFRELTSENAARFAQFSSTSSLFLPRGALPVVGSRIHNPALARTYEQIGRRGIGALYGGPIGQDVVSTVRALPLAPGATLVPRPGAMSIQDLARYDAPIVAPTHVSYRGYDVFGMAPSSSGGTTVGESLNILSSFDIAAESRVQQLHHFLEATRLAFADRNRFIGDPRFVRVPLAQLLSPDFGRQRACLIDPAHALTSPVAPGDPFAASSGCTPIQPAAASPAQAEAHTNHLVVADRWGDVASYTNTIEQLGGSGIVVPGRGFLLNNELTDFDFAPPSSGAPDPNLPAAGKRPRSSMSPTIVLHHARPFLAVGAAGGATIITTVLQILMDRIDLGMSLPDAIAAPRASQRNSPTTQAEPAFIALPTTPGLERLGQSFAVSDTSPLDPTIKIAPTIGVASGLEFLHGNRLLAAAEPVRRGGGARTRPVSRRGATGRV